MADNQRYLGNLLKGAMYGVLNLALAIAIGLVLAPYIYDILGQRHYGINNIAAGLVGAFALIDFGITGAVSRYFTVAYAKGEKEECIRLGNTAFFLYLALGSIGIVGITSVAICIYFIYPEMEDRLLLLLVLAINAVSFGISFPMNALNGIVNGTLRQELTGTRNLVFRIIGVVVTVLVLISGGRLISLAVSGLMITMVNFAVSYRLVFTAFPDFVFHLSAFHKTLLKKLFSYGFFTFLFFVGQLLRNNGSIFLISAMISIDANSLYGLIVLGLTDYYFNISETVLGNWLTSWLTLLHTNHDESLLDKTLRLAYKMSVCIATFIAFGLIVWGQDFLMRWGGKRGEEFLTAYPALVLLTLSVWVTQCQVPNTKYLFAVAKHAFIGYASLIGYSVGLMLAAISICLGFGVNGVAFSMLLAAIGIRGIAVPVYLYRIIRNESVLRYYLNISLYVMLAGLSCVIPYIISQSLLAPNYSRLFLVGILSTITYFPVFFLLVLDKVEKEKIMAIIFSRLKRSR